ncbi:MAG TPA: right-handed parallel beta-helix repeat-containing protein [Acidobacteriota bacterium]|nr:right-handed parallel beta-helix repeat-containing protein [Acidobacteriota bacterium]
MRADRARGPAPFALVAALLAAATILPSSADAKRRFVPKEHRTIQAAIDAAAPGDTVWVAAGTYHGTITMKKPLTLFGDGGPDSTILDGGDSTRVLHVEGVKGGSVIGFGIRRGKAPAGGGAYLLRDSSFMFVACTFTRNWESAVAAWESYGIAVTDCRFEENQGSAIQFNHSRGYITQSQFTRNTGNGGGAVALNQSEVIGTFRRCTFDENRATKTVGGAVFADSSRFVMADCSFTGNSSTVAGGAIAGVGRSHMSISRSRFRENRAPQGGALHSDASLFLVGLSVFDRNQATAGGAAIGMVGRIDANINPILRNNTFYKNTTNGSGGTVFAVKTSPEIEKNIFVVEGKEQLAVAGLESSPLYTCNLIHDPSGIALGALPSTDTFVGDPLFCGAAEGNFDLRDLSPALRAPCGPIGARKQGCSTFQLQPSR